MNKKEVFKILIGIVIIFFISILLEGIVFNINSFRILENKYQYKQINITEDILNGLEKVEDNKYIATKDNPEIEINNINMPTGTIKINLNRDGYKHNIKQRKTDVIIWYTDATSKYFRKTPAKTINALEERSQYGVLHFSGNTKALKIQIQISKGETIELNSIELNKRVPYNFNKTRFNTVFLIITALYLLFNLKIFDEEYNIKNVYHFFISLAIFMIFVFALANISVLADGTGGSIFSDQKNKKNIVYEQYYTNAIIDGKLNLPIEPDSRLEEIENTYDTTTRDIEQVKYIYDYAYYNGKYYVYFTILPQLLINVPFKLITGQYINIAYEIFLFALLGSLFAMLTVIKLVKKYFKNVSLRMMVLSMFTALFSSVVLYLVGRPLVYEVAGTCGYWLIMQAMFFFTLAFNKEKIGYKCLTLGCISAALAVNARPNLLIVSLLILPIFIENFIKKIKKIKEEKTKENIKYLIKYILCIILPYGIIGTGIMILNYIRFGNIMEFGAKYQLTSNDMINLGYRYSTIPIGIWHYLFNPPVIDLTFPFIHMKPVTPLYIGFYGCGYVGIGTFLATPICLMLFSIPILRKYIKNKNIQLWRLIRNSLIIALIMIVVITLVAASYERYSLDYTWMIVWPAIAIMLTLHEILKENNIAKKIFEKVCSIATIICICVSLAMAVKSESNFIEKGATKDYDDIATDMMFWE